MYRNRLIASSCQTGVVLALIAGFVSASTNLWAKQKDAVQYGMGVIVNIPFSGAEVAQVVQDVVQNGIIRGTKEYNKDEYITGATAQSSVKGFPAWTDDGKVFYKVRAHAVDPRNFKDSGDVGMLAVRYILQSQGEKNTVLRIEAVFVEDFRHTVHLSNGSVESAEYKDIRDRLDAIAVMKAQSVEAERERREQASQKSAPVERAAASDSSPTALEAAGRENPALMGSAAAVPTVPQTLEERVKDLRRQVERLVKAPGAPLKSAPFHTATTLQSLPGGAEVLIVITTPYWLGVETHDGQHGWMLRDDLELLP